MGAETNSLSKIEHVVVLMFENCSFDNLLGWLYDPENEAHSIFHSRFLGAKQKPISDLQRSAMHGAALLMQEGDLHERIDRVENEFEADLLLMEHEAKLVKDKLLKKFE